MNDMQTIHYRKVQTKKHIDPKPYQRMSRLANLDNVLVRIAKISTTLIAYETLLLIELNQTEINVTKIIKLMRLITPLINSQLMELGEITLTNHDLAEQFISELKKNVMHQPQIWEKYHADLFFSYQVEKYYEQLNYLISSELQNQRNEGLRYS